MFGQYGFSQFTADIYKKIVKLLSNFFFVGNMNSIFYFEGAGKFKLLVVFFNLKVA